MFVAASKTFLILYGRHYTTRSWCLLELFVFFSCQRVGVLDADALQVVPLAGDKSGPTVWELGRFNLLSTGAFHEHDRQTIFGIVETAGDGKIGLFTESLRSVANTAEMAKARKVADLEEKLEALQAQVIILAAKMN